MDLHEIAQLLGNFGEFFGAIAVVVTLGYLALQIRQNTDSLQANARHAISESFNRLNLMMAELPELAEVLSEGNAGLSNLQSYDEKYRIGYENYNIVFMRAYEEAYAYYRRGYLDDSYWGKRAKMLKAYISLPGVSEWWRGSGIAGPHRVPRSDGYDPEFVQMIEELLA